MIFSKNNKSYMISKNKSRRDFLKVAGLGIVRGQSIGFKFPLKTKENLERDEKK